MLAESFVYIVEIDAEALGFDDELFELLLKELGFLSFGGGGSRGDDGRGSGADFEEAGVNEAGDDFVRSVGINFELARERTNGGEFVARAELAGDDGFGGGVDDLLVDGGARAEVDAEGEHEWSVL